MRHVRALNQELRSRRIYVTAVCPGAVKTEFFNRALTKKHLPAYKKLVMADPKKVIKKAWKDNEQNKEISVYGKAIKLTHLVTKILPHSLFLQFIGSLYIVIKSLTLFLCIFTTELSVQNAYG